MECCQALDRLDVILRKIMEIRSREKRFSH